MARKPAQVHSSSPADREQRPRINVVGTGYLGATHAAAMAEMGFDVIGVDSDPRKVEALSRGVVPFFEPGLPELIRKHVESGRLTFTTNLIPDQLSAELVWNPEFLREGKAVHDTLFPDRIVLGGTNAVSEALMREVYAIPIAAGTPVVVCDLPTAELVKVSANAFLATKISFINAIAEVCEAAGADVAVLADALGYDVRIGRQFLNAGLGFGGGCLPKDIRALMHRASELGAYSAANLLQQVDEINMGQRQRVIDQAIDACGGSVLNRRIAVLGAAFKPHTDDVRDSPALNVAAALHLRGAQVTVFDPEASLTARRDFPTLGYVDSIEEAAIGADAVLVLTEWDAFGDIEPSQLDDIVRSRRIIDARNCLDSEKWIAGGWDFRALGRTPRVTAVAGVRERLAASTSEFTLV
jgi:UDPglucose 6-dehydrogenase